MKLIHHDLPLRFVKLLNTILMVVPFAIVWSMVYSAQSTIKYYSVGNGLMIFLFWMLYLILGRVYDAFLVSLNRISEMIYSQVLAILVSNFLIYIIMCLVIMQLPNPLYLIGTVVVEIVISMIWSVTAHRWYFRNFPPKKTAVVYDHREGLENLISQYGLSKKFEVVKAIAATECAAQLDALKEIEAVFLSDIHSHERNMILKYCIQNNITVYVIPRIGDVIMSGAKKMHMFHLPMLRISRYYVTPEYLILKRCFDIVLSLLGLIILSETFLITAIAIKRYDGGPVFYKQRRLTKDGKEFEILKFRSMSVDAEKDGVARLSTGDADDRITPVGHVIRKLRIDELPQLINILKGDLSIVGPRPERPEIAAEYEKELPEFRLRLQAKAGLTGYAQVYGKYNTTPYNKLQMDLMYIANSSIWEDLKICFATIKILFLSDSTEGIESGKKTAGKN